MTRISDSDANRWLQVAARSGWRVGATAKAIGISTREFKRWTNRAFGQKPHDWLMGRRLHDAPDLLKAQHPVKAVAFALGFKQLSHFSREFKHCYGVCPSVFQIRNADEGYDGAGPGGGI